MGAPCTRHFKQVSVSTCVWCTIPCWGIVIAFGVHSRHVDLGRTKAYRLLSSNEGRHICFVVVTSFSYLVFTDVGLDIAVMCADISVQRHCDFSQLVWVRYHAPITVKGGINPCMLLYQLGGPFFLEATSCMLQTQ